MNAGKTEVKKDTSNGAEDLVDEASASPESIDKPQKETQRSRSDDGTEVPSWDLEIIGMDVQTGFDKISKDIEDMGGQVWEKAVSFLPVLANPSQTREADFTSPSPQHSQTAVSNHLSHVMQVNILRRWCECLKTTALIWFQLQKMQSDEQTFLEDPHSNAAGAGWFASSLGRPNWFNKFF